MSFFNRNDKMIKDLTPMEELQLELVAVEDEIKWFDVKLKNEGTALSAQQRYDLLKKKHCIISTMKFYQ